jgi:hypothetical protein
MGIPIEKLKLDAVVRRLQHVQDEAAHIIDLLAKVTKDSHDLPSSKQLAYLTSQACRELSQLEGFMTAMHHSAKEPNQ